MRRLDYRKWEPKPRGKTLFMYPGLDLYCHYWKDYKKRPEAKVDYPEVMTGQGSCWFTTREWNDYIGLLDEGVGSWGNVGIEVSLRTWLCGGRQIVNKNCWQAHWFRVSEGGFPYPFSGRQVAKAHRYTWENYYFKDNAFENQVRPFYWYIEKFAPVPSWEVYLKDQYKPNRVIVYYTDNDLESSLANAVRKHLSKVNGGRLGHFYAPATVVSLILSDVIGNDPAVIASGPTFPDSSTFSDALYALRKYDLLARTPQSVLDFLKRGHQDGAVETPKTLSNCHNYIIGDNRLALEAMLQKAKQLGFTPHIITSKQNS